MRSSYWTRLPFTSRHPTRFAECCSQAKRPGPRFSRTPRSSSISKEGHQNPRPRRSSLGRQLASLKHWECDLTALPERLGNCTALTTLNLTDCRSLTALLERIGDCAVLTALNLPRCSGITALSKRLDDCVALTTLNLRGCHALTALPDRLDDCAALMTMTWLYCRGLTMMSE